MRQRRKVVGVAMPFCDKLISCALLITQNAEREILEDAAIAISGDRISDIGPASLLLPRWTPADRLDLGHALVMPGLVNAHTHAAMTFLRGLADDLPLLEWLQESVFPVEGRLTAEISRMGALLGYAEMIATGTTACVDMYIFEDAVFEAARMAGLRCMGGEAVFAFPSAACADHRAALDRTRELAARHAGEERIKVAVNPHSVYTTNPQILGECRELALELELPIHIHLAETKTETGNCIRDNGMRPIAWCDANGLFDARVIAAHLVDITAAEGAFLAAKGACGAHNPSSNMKLASGAAPVSVCLDAGLVLGLGTDGPASNNSLNMFTEMGRAALLQKLAQNDPSALSAGKTLDMATLGGAAVFGDPDLGSLETGKKADLVALDLSLPNMMPMHNPVSQVVYAAGGHECRLTMVGGEILYRDGKFSRFNLEDLREEARQLRDFASRQK